MCLSAHFCFIFLNGKKPQSPKQNYSIRLDSNTKLKVLEEKNCPFFFVVFFYNAVIKGKKLQGKAAAAERSKAQRA